MYRIVYDKQAVKDIKNLKSARLDDKAKKLIEVIRETPFQNPPPYEALVGNLQGVYSRRINIQHRLVYQVYSEPVEWKGMRYDGTVKIIRMESANIFTPTGRPKATGTHCGSPFFMVE